MNKTILLQAGIYYVEGVERFSGYAAMYEKYLKLFPTDPTFAALKQAMADENYDLAFRNAHTLKGLAGNISLHTLAALDSELVEALRAEKDIPQAKRLLPQVEQAYHTTVQAIRDAAE